MRIINGIRRDGYMFSRHIIVQDAGVIAVLLPKRDFGRACQRRRTVSSRRTTDEICLYSQGIARLPP